MGGIFSAPKPPPPPPEDDLLRKQLEMQKRERDRAKAASDARLRNLRRRGQRRPLLFSSYAGVRDRVGQSDTLG